MLSTINTSNYSLTNLTNINIMLGKNGCGKSTILRDITEMIFNDTLIGYISPQRGGLLHYNPGVESTMRNNHGWQEQSRKVNYSDSFKPQSIANYRNLELNVLRKYQHDTEEQKQATPFNYYINLINELLDEIEIKPDASTFSILKKSSGSPLKPEQISSGESELICLGIECLSFIHELSNKDGILLLDEPDVHLHPDLQDRLIKFLFQLLKENNKLQILIATHSTAIVGALSYNESSSICFIEPDSYYITNNGPKKEINFKKINYQYKKILPIFGAHPLTSIYCESPILLVEGEDDVRIWQQVVRSSKNKIKLSPIECGSKDEIKNHENIANSILKAIYSPDAKGYSLRDGDNNIGQPIQDEDQIIRLKLNCYAAENCLLSNDVLEYLKISWENMKELINKWLKEHEGKKSRKDYTELLGFKENGFNRKVYKIKDSRNILIGLSDNNKPWEIIVGQVITNLILNSNSCDKSDDSLYDYLGEKLFNCLVNLSK